MTKTSGDLNLTVMSGISTLKNSRHHYNDVDRSLVKFYAGIRSEYTKKLYSKYLDYFLRFVKIKEAGGLLQLKDSALQDMVEDYIISLKNKKLRKSSVDGRIGALELFFSMNDKVLNWKKIRKMSPEELKRLGGGVWTNEEIKKMLKLTTSKRNCAFIHTLASTGCRIGSIPELRLRNVSEMPYGCRAILFYEGSKSEYYGFLTPEATRALDEYLEERKKAGELLKPESWLFRKNYRIGIEKMKPMSYESCRSMMREIVRKIRGVGDGSRRDVAMFHGFRKRFNTILKNNKEVNISLAERLMSHFNKLVPLNTI